MIGAKNIDSVATDRKVSVIINLVISLMGHKRRATSWRSLFLLLSGAEVTVVESRCLTAARQRLGKSPHLCCSCCRDGAQTT